MQKSIKFNINKHKLKLKFYGLFFFFGIYYVKSQWLATCWSIKYLYSSNGGARAQISIFYLKQKKKLRTETIKFSATGLYSGIDLPPFYFANIQPEAKQQKPHCNILALPVFSGLHSTFVVVHYIFKSDKRRKKSIAYFFLLFLI
jgi:hypothetical protein